MIYSYSMIEIFSSKISFISSILDYEKKVSKTLNSPDDASRRFRAFSNFILQKLYKIIYWDSVI